MSSDVGTFFFFFEKLDVGTFVSLCLILRQGLQRLRNQRAELKGSRRRCHCVNTRIHPPTTLADAEVVASLHRPPDTGGRRGRPHDHAMG